MEFYASVRLAVFWPVIRRWRAMKRRARELRRAPTGNRSGKPATEAGRGQLPERLS